MPRPSLPPTPAASTELAGKDRPPLSATEKTLNLPPPAIAPSRTPESSTTENQTPSAANTHFTLPPPPTRSRTIIQMKPKSQQTGKTPRPTSRSGSKFTDRKPASGSSANSKKQPSATSVAGKRIARKTAHSVIERRRRSKMNEEFATLKSMIPACVDQDMHKLSILKASIDYFCYLERCITDLKAANNSLSTPLVHPQAPPPRMQDPDDEDEDEGQQDEDDVTIGKTESNGTSHSQPIGQDQARACTKSQSVTQSHHPNSSDPSSVSTLPSPAYEPQQHGRRSSQSYFSHSASTSPTIMPNKERDREATAALLMLNKDRRNPKGIRGMSVRDLLSS